MALDGRRTKAAALLGGGVPANRVAAEVGINARQLRRWRKEPDFAALESASRGDVLAGSRTLHNVLEAALVATTPKGAPDWSALESGATPDFLSGRARGARGRRGRGRGPSRRIVIHRPDLLPPGELERPLGDGAETMIVEHE
jgi:hypothetical protein